VVANGCLMGRYIRGHGGHLLALIGRLSEGDGLLAEGLLCKHLAGPQTQRHLVGGSATLWAPTRPPSYISASRSLR